MHIWQMYTQWFQFVTHPAAFVVHRPHAPSAGYKATFKVLRPRSPLHPFPHPRSHCWGQPVDMSPPPATSPCVHDKQPRHCVTVKQIGLHRRHASWCWLLQGPAYSTKHRGTAHLFAMERLSKDMIQEVKAHTYAPAGVSAVAHCRPLPQPPHRADAWW